MGIFSYIFRIYDNLALKRDTKPVAQKQPSSVKRRVYGAIALIYIGLMIVLLVTEKFKGGITKAVITPQNVLADMMVDARILPSGDVEVTEFHTVKVDGGALQKGYKLELPKWYSAEETKKEPIRYQVRLIARQQYNPYALGDDSSLCALDNEACWVENISLPTNNIENLEDVYIITVGDPNAAEPIPRGTYRFTVQYKALGYIKTGEELDTFEAQLFGQWSVPIEKSAVVIRFPPLLLSSSIIHEVSKELPLEARAEQVEGEEFEVHKKQLIGEITADEQKAEANKLTYVVGDLRPMESVKLKIQFPSGFIKRESKVVEVPQEPALVSE